MSDGTKSVMIKGEEESFALIVADFPEVDEAQIAYEMLRVSPGNGLEVEAAIVVTKGDNGKLEVVATTDHSTRDGIGWGVLAGAIVGVLFPPTILAGALMGGVAGSIIGKLREAHHSHEIEHVLEGSIRKGHSAVIVFAENPDQFAQHEAFVNAVSVTQQPLSKESVDEIKEVMRESENSSSDS